MTERVVWVTEDNGLPTGVCIHLENVHEDGRSEFVRYVPAEQQGWMTLDQDYLPTDHEYWFMVPMGKRCQAVLRDRIFIDGGYGDDGQDMVCKFVRREEHDFSVHEATHYAPITGDVPPPLPPLPDPPAATGRGFAEPDGQHVGPDAYPQNQPPVATDPKPSEKP